MIYEWIEEYWLTAILVVVAIALLIFLGQMISLDMEVKSICLSMGYPDYAVIRPGGTRAFCKNQLESVEILLPEEK